MQNNNIDSASLSVLSAESVVPFPVAMSASEKLQTRCIIVGGGPAGMMAGYLLGRAGVPVVVLEKHADFFRDFRGDTIHPSTLELMNELGLADRFLRLPHSEISQVEVSNSAN